MVSNPLPHCLPATFYRGPHARGRHCLSLPDPRRARPGPHSGSVSAPSRRGTSCLVQEPGVRGSAQCPVVTTHDYSPGGAWAQPLGAGPGRAPLFPGPTRPSDAGPCALGGTDAPSSRPWQAWRPRPWARRSEQTARAPWGRGPDGSRAGWPEVTGELGAAFPGAGGRDAACGGRGSGRPGPLGPAGGRAVPPLLAKDATSRATRGRDSSRRPSRTAQVREPRAAMVRAGRGVAQDGSVAGPAPAAPTRSHGTRV